MATQTHTARVIGLLAEAYRKDISALSVTIYHNVIRDHDDEDIATAANEWIRTRRFLPTPAELRDLTLEAQHLRRAQTAQLAQPDPGDLPPDEHAFDWRAAGYTMHPRQARPFDGWDGETRPLTDRERQHYGAPPGADWTHDHETNRPLMVVPPPRDAIIAMNRLREAMGLRALELPPAPTE